MTNFDGTAEAPDDHEHLDQIALAMLAMLLIGSALSASVFVPQSVGDVLAISPVIGLVALAVRRSPRLLVSRPRGVVPWAVALYVILGGATVVVSIATFTSVKYAVGGGAVISAAFIALPSLFGDKLLQVLAKGTFVAAVALTLVGFVLFLVGPIDAAQGVTGRYLPVELVFFGRSAGFTLPLITGMFGSPGNQAIGVAIGIVAGVCLHSGSTSKRTSRSLEIGIGICAIGLFLTFSRTAWIVCCFGLAVPCVVGILRKRVFVPAAVLLAVFTVAAGMMLSSHLTVNARFDVYAQRYGLEAAKAEIAGVHADITIKPSKSGGGAIQTADVQVKGGADSSSRRIIWSASVEAIKDRPLLGYGVGTDTDAIAPHLTGPAKVYRGLTSHSTFLRTGVEGGLALLGLLVFIEVAVLLQSAIHVLRRARSITPDALAVTAVSVAFLPALLTESLLFGGLTLLSILWVLSAGAVLTTLQKSRAAET